MPDVSAPVVASVTQITAGISREREPEPKDVEDAPRPAHTGPAVVAEFPVKPQIPAAVAVPTLPSGPVSLVELIERRGGFDWREAVAVIQQICVYLRDHSPQTPILLDPRTIQITDRGEVNLLSGQTSSDPLVIQVGRLLRTMLMGKEVPPELRLLLSQATFELPIFESIEDVARALAQLNKLDEPGPAGLALLRAVAAPPPPPDPEHDFDHRPPPIRSILPATKASGRRKRSRAAFGSIFGGYGMHVAVILAGAALIAVLLQTKPAVLFAPDGDAPLQTPLEAGGTSAVPRSTSGSSTPGTAPLTGSNASAQHPNGSRRPTTSARRSDAPAPTTAGNRPSHQAGVPSEPRGGAPKAEATLGASTVIISPPPSTGSLTSRDHERRARELAAAGRLDEASDAFDRLLLNNPLYEPRTNEITPEALAAFRKSQRTVLPSKALSDYDKGRAALAGGDYDAALRLAREGLAIADKRPDWVSPQVRDQLEDLIEAAQFAAATATEIIYSEADLDVIPPRQLSRQMPVNGPVGVPPNRVGWLDMIINKDGTVFQVKLHTPLNRHHERMIVSPAKAWLFRPATRNGKTVMYRIKVKVNLPESGTDF
jgi:hypothetical protein